MKGASGQEDRLVKSIEGMLKVMIILNGTPLQGKLNWHGHNTRKCFTKWIETNKKDIIRCFFSKQEP